MLVPANPAPLLNCTEFVAPPGEPPPPPAGQLTVVAPPFASVQSRTLVPDTVPAVSRAASKPCTAYPSLKVLLLAAALGIWPEVKLDAAVTTFAVGMLES